MKKNNFFWDLKAELLSPFDSNISLNLDNIKEYINLCKNNNNTDLEKKIRKNLEEKIINQYHSSHGVILLVNNPVLFIIDNLKKKNKLDNPDSIFNYMIFFKKNYFSIKNKFESNNILFNNNSDIFQFGIKDLEVLYVVTHIWEDKKNPDPYNEQYKELSLLLKDEKRIYGV